MFAVWAYQGFTNLSEHLGQESSLVWGLRCALFFEGEPLGFLPRVASWLKNEPGLIEHGTRFCFQPSDAQPACSIAGGDGLLLAPDCGPKDRRSHDLRHPHQLRLSGLVVFHEGSGGGALEAQLGV